ncbi:hypothetical protein C1645_838896 [Glomus cerebriforme]|uniref:Uncharacterized protein n=1 Tax=Glomus cerebriforme TaxID=658196 RepID=A0A397S4C0_9GLOM|nr:hypothetical protein C1645_838896 [Glomus cerebriforme]
MYIVGFSTYVFANLFNDTEKKIIKDTVRKANSNRKSTSKSEDSCEDDSDNNEESDGKVKQKATELFKITVNFQSQEEGRLSFSASISLLISSATNNKLQKLDNYLKKIIKTYNENKQEVNDNIFGNNNKCILNQVNIIGKLHLLVSQYETNHKQKEVTKMIAQILSFFFKKYIRNELQDKFEENVEPTYVLQEILKIIKKMNKKN